jgi:Chitobiase/beta-hexosaminidase C-terminal domain
VLVTVTDKDGTTATQTVTPAGGSWTASFAAGGFADGPVEATLQMTMAGGQFAGVGRTITKDTVAPGAPTASVAPGTYQSAINVALAGENVRYTTDGSTPTAGSQAYGSAISVNRSQTLKAVSVDAAGNTSAVAEFPYTIQAPAAAVAPIVRAPIASRPNIAAPARLRLESLSVARSMKLRTARRSGVRLRILAPDGAKAVRVRLSRGNKTIATVVRRVTGDGVLTVVLPRTNRQRRALRRGTYRLQITPGTSTRKLDGVTSTRRITLRERGDRSGGILSPRPAPSRSRALRLSD